MNIHVIYHTKTGHSRQIAHAVAHSLDVEATDLKDLNGPLLSDLMFLVTGVYGGKADPKVTAFIAQLSPDHVKQVCLITSSIGNTPQIELRQLLQSGGIQVLRDEYTCKGSFLLFGLGHPSEGELQQAADFARSVADSV